MTDTHASDWSAPAAIRRRMRDDIRRRVAIILGAIPGRAANVQRAIQEACLGVSDGQHYALDALTGNQLERITGVLMLDEAGLGVYANWPATRRDLVEKTLGRAGTVWELDRQDINLLLVHIRAYEAGYWDGMRDAREIGASDDL